MEKPCKEELARLSKTFDHTDANGESHCDDGPSTYTIDGTLWWFRHGKLHRDVGPAVERADGSVEYWLDGKRIDKEESFPYWEELERKTKYRKKTISQMLEELGMLVE